MWFKAPFFWFVCVGFPIYCLSADEESFPEFTLDWFSFARQSGLVMKFTLLATLAMAVLMFVTETFHSDGQFAHRLAEYLFWAFLQQIGFQTFLTRRVQRVLTGPKISALASSTIFALIHLPNPSLVTLTWISGYFWSLAFLRNPNLYALTLSHGWLAVLTFYCVPMDWTRSFRIGPGYWIW